MPGSRELCVYCGERKGTTRDHVAPRCLFGDTKPQQLLTVPACAQCNNALTSPDDIFLQDALVLDIDNSHPIATTLLNTKVLRSVARNRSEVARIVVAAVAQPRYDMAGTYVEEAASAELPKGRVASIIIRMVRGLYYCERNAILAQDHQLIVLRQPATLFPRLSEALKQASARTFGDVFGFAWIHIPAPFAMIWLLWFYDSVVYSVTSTSIHPPFEGTHGR